MASQIERYWSRFRWGSPEGAEHPLVGAWSDSRTLIARMGVSEGYPPNTSEGGWTPSTRLDLTASTLAPSWHWRSLEHVIASHSVVPHVPPCPPAPDGYEPGAEHRSVG